MRRSRGGAGLLAIAALTVAIAGSPAAQAGSPAGLPGCGKAKSSFANPASVPVPDGPGSAVTSAIAVAGLSNRLLDVDVTTFLQHTFPGDIDMTLTSPAGTVVTLTTDNGGTNDNVFDGTVWDDSANPGGQVPYTNNNGLVTDNAYSNMTTASPLAPEEALAAFNGQNPNGVWTLTVSDDTNIDTGTLNKWTLDLTTLTSAPPPGSSTSFADTPSLAVPDAPGGPVTATITVAGAGSYLSDVDVTTFLRHTFPGDIDMTLTSPAGTVVTLTTDNGGTNDNVFDGTVWDDSANPGGQVPYASNNGLATDQVYSNLTTATPLASEEPLGAFIGENPNGIWTLKINDDAPSDVGGLSRWGLDIDTVLPCSAPSTLSIDDASKAEGDSGSSTADLAVNLSAPWSSPVKVDYTTADGTASQPDDYAPSSGTLTFAPGETSKTISVEVNGDTVDEPDETVAVDLSAPSAATIADGHAQLTIVDDDATPTVQPPDTAPPDTTIAAKPPKKTKKRKATFEFSAGEPRATFTCSLDGAAFSPCSSPLTVGVKPGRHTFTVIAADAAGNADKSPATYSWTVTKKRKRHRS